MRYVFRSSIFSVVVLGVGGLIVGCVNESDNPNAKIAENAIGITDNKTTKSVNTTRDLQIVDSEKVIDAKTGETIHETTKTTPVKVTKELTEKVNVDVNVGATKSTSSGAATPPVK
ncbi:hypothetical protein SAMN05444166_1825 [Singulisphaera sp. GP187]|uniref:hypothetical protein n=1 Tax=Singulisphaera sp. GP187 TaxID=1882752 RepID=UPI0009258BF1|nr:hypothetical protein [Singulisphaera sp. GP187]SIN96718.1 hypothetical protein SAMN05444166_1825 [Singulisphaera sp. GP187]